MRPRSALFLALAFFACTPRVLVPYRAQTPQTLVEFRAALVKALPARLRVIAETSNGLEFSDGARIELRDDLVLIEADPKPAVELTLLANEVACQQGFGLMRATTVLPDGEHETEVRFHAPTAQDADELMNRISWTHAVDGSERMPGSEMIPLRGDAYDLVRATEELAQAACDSGVYLRLEENAP